MVANLDATILSYQVGAMKPSPEIYEVAETAAGVPPNQILFIDDKQENVDAAIGRGWHSRQCFGGEGAIAVLREFGVV
jgi:HAD superfamily hydrolase (TIGR01509 family)